jgi:ABC-type branched-subunit amino acid transport system substrate-binding protein
LFDSLKLWAWQLAPSWLPHCRGRWPDSGKQGRAPLLSGPDRCGVSLEVIDAYPSAASAMRAAEASRPEVVFGPYGSWPALAAAAASKGVVWNHGGATARLARPAYPRVVNAESPAYRYLAAVLETLVAEGVGEGSEVVIMHVDTGFGREVAEGAAVAARRLGLQRRSVTFRPGRARDVLAQIPAGDVLLSAGSFDDDVAIAQGGQRIRLACSWIGRRGGR